MIEPMVHGIVAPGFEPVLEEFRRNFVERGEVGAALCVHRHGEPLIDVWGGWADAARSRPWRDDTLVDFYSAGKALVSSLVLRAISAVGLSLDDRVVDVWPEFAAGGKEWVTLRDALSHRAAVPAIREPLTDDDLFDWSAMTTALAGTDPWWRAGERHAHHTNTFHVNPPGYSSIGVVNTARWRSAQLPSTNGHGSARGLAHFYTGLLDPGRIVHPDLLAEATRPQSVGPCPILRDEAVFGLGFTPTTARRPLGPNQHSFGHFGTGGAVGFADPDTGIAFGYVMNHVVPRWQSTRNRALIDRLFGLLEPSGAGG